jgi:hypothetical protein
MSEESKNQEKASANVLFGGGTAIAVVGILGGVGIALGFPWIVLAYGQALGPKYLMVFVIAALITGGLVALTSAFFGLVMPRSVADAANWQEDWKKWAEYADLAEPDYKNWTLKDWKAWGEKKKKKWREKGK